MALADDIAVDYQHVDGIETVTHTEQPAGTATNTVKGFRTGLSFRELALGGPAAIENKDIVWELWSATLRSGAVPKGGDTVTDSANTVFNILSITETTIGTTSIKHRCVCREQVSD